MPTTIAPGVFDITLRVTGSGKRYRAFLVEDDVPTLFDVGLPDTTDALFEAIDDLGVDPKRVVITHGDGDHIGGLEATADRYDPETWIPAETAVPDTLGSSHRYGDGDTIGSFVAVHAPGHEPDNYVLIDEHRGLAVMGDAVSGADQRGLPTGYFHLPPAVYSQDLNQAEASLDRLLDFEFEMALVFHGSSVLEDARAKLDAYVNFPNRPSED